jgi:lipopolysaccharide/colanic/teichoic acid biosynthesis glycosyltransferase
MLIRLPWLFTRRRLLVALLLDCSLFALLFAGWFQLRFGSWPSFSLPLTWLLEFWLLCSYVLGRYYDQEERPSAMALKQLVRTLLTLLLSTAVYLAYLWITAIGTAPTDARGFLLPFLLALALSSGLVQFGLNTLLSQRFADLESWLVVGSAGFRQRLESELQWARLTARLVEESAAPERVVVEDFSLLPPEQQRRLLVLQADGAAVHSTLGWCEQVLQRFPPDLLQTADLLRGEFAAPHGSLQKRLKRLGDVLVSGLLLVLTSPLLLLATLLIRLEDHGPVLYGQVRSGLNGLPFQVWKLRSMRVNAEARGAQWSGRGDPRITRIGRLLRVTRLDELPQLWAVLRGQMSLIGPRPERPEIEQELEQQIPHYRLRHLIRPGLSGWAQVNYPYGASLEDSANKLSYDLYYLRNFSFWLDLLILLKTMRLVFNARGAIAVEK